jgi:GT2 family glycosyltransferase
MLPPYVISIILNTSRCEDTLECLTSLAKSAYGNHQAIVLDNGSSDGSVEAIRSNFPSVEIIELRENHGYAGNNNVGIDEAVAQGADWVFVLNEDTELDPECLARLVEVGESSAEIGIVGPMVYHHDEPAYIQSAGGKLSYLWNSVHLAKDEPDKGQFVTPHDVDFISGCGIMFRRLLLEEAGAFDQRFFYYKEETELCLRARRAGWRVVHVPEAKLWHKGVQRDYHPNPYVTYYATRNRFMMMAKHRAPWHIWLIVWADKLRTLTSWTLKPKWRAKRAHRDAMLRGMLDFLRGNWGQMPS